jgi:NTE family protein
VEVRDCRVALSALLAMTSLGTAALHRGALFMAALTLTACGGLPDDYARADAPIAGRLSLPGGRPMIALVLGSGGPRGFAHIGVIKALEAAGIQPDLIVGTSSGALVGSLYAAGFDAAELERRAMAFDLARVFDFTFNKFGKFKGEGLQKLVNEVLQGKPIEQLKRPLAIVATKVPIGEMTLFTQGNTGLAVRASSAIAGSFVPVKIRGATYMDGDLVSPVPVLAAKLLGADLIIAVDVSADLADTPPLENIPLDWVSTGVIRKTLIERETEHAAVMIRPRLPYYAGASQEYKRTAIAAGEAAGRAAVAQIRASIEQARLVRR